MQRTDLTNDNHTREMHRDGTYESAQAERTTQAEPISVNKASGTIAIDTPSFESNQSRNDRTQDVYGSSKLTMSVPQAADWLGISRAFAYELVARGEIPSIRLGRRVLVPIKRLFEFVSENEP